MKGHGNARGKGSHRCHAHAEPKEKNYGTRSAESALDLCKPNGLSGLTKMGNFRTDHGLPP